jgi:hypothetical protein
LGEGEAQGSAAICGSIDLWLCVDPNARHTDMALNKSLSTGHSQFGSIEYGERVFVSCVFAIFGCFYAIYKWKSTETRYLASIGRQA